MEFFLVSWLDLYSIWAAALRANDKFILGSDAKSELVSLWVEKIAEQDLFLSVLLFRHDAIASQLDRTHIHTIRNFFLFVCGPSLLEYTKYAYSKKYLLLSRNNIILIFRIYLY